MAAEEVKPAAEAAKPATAEVAKPVVEKQTNCLACNKPIKKIKRYYRDGKFYCSKKCWTDFKNKPQEEKK